MKRLGLISRCGAMCVAWIWSVLAGIFSPLTTTWIGLLAVILLLVGTVYAIVARSHPQWRRSLAVALPVLMVVATFVSQRPDPNQTWVVEHRVAPSILHVTSDGQSRYEIDGIRCGEPALGGKRFESKTVDVADVRTIWLGVQHFTVISPIAHTFVSFGLRDGDFLAVSVELARAPEGQSYSPLAGLFRRYQLVCVIGSEQEVTGRAFGELAKEPFPLYLYQIRATPEQAQAMFRAVVDRVNALQDHPEFYNTLFNNCTTNIVDRCNEIAPIYISPYHPRVMFPGYTGSVAYEQGLLGDSLPFADIKQAARLIGERGCVKAP